MCGEGAGAAARVSWLALSLARAQPLTLSLILSARRTKMTVDPPGAPGPPFQTLSYSVLEPIMFHLRQLAGTTPAPRRRVWSRATLAAFSDAELQGRAATLSLLTSRSRGGRPRSWRRVAGRGRCTRGRSCGRARAGG